MPSQAVSALRLLISERFPERARREGGGIATGSPVDDALGGGLPAGRLTEIVSAIPGSGGQTVLACLLASTRAARQRVALVDASDGFAPECVPDDMLRHLVWVRCRAPAEAFAAADILVRDGNYAALVVDLRGCTERALRRTPASVWYRLQRAAEGGSVAVLVQTPVAIVPAAPWRLVLESPARLADADLPREILSRRVAVRTERSPFQIDERLAG